MTLFALVASLLLLNYIILVLYGCRIRTNSSSLSVARGTADVRPAFRLVAAIVYWHDWKQSMNKNQHAEKNMKPQRKREKREKARRRKNRKKKKNNNNTITVVVSWAVKSIGCASIMWNSAQNFVRNTGRHTMTRYHEIVRNFSDKNCP